MKGKYIGKKKMDFLAKDNHIALIENKVYDILSEEKGFFRVVDESGEDYLYPKSFFEIVQK
jgi:hypothetical protein